MKRIRNFAEHSRRLRPRWRTSLFLLAFPVFLGAARGETDQVKELGTYLRQHGYGVMPVDLRGNNAQSVEAEINGRIVNLMVDTGCDHTQLTAGCARELHLDVHDSGTQEWGVGGTVAGHVGVALIQSFKLNNYEINRLNTIDVLPKSARLAADGLLGFDYLRLNAAILPVGANEFLYKPGNGAAAPLDRYMAALGFKGIPLHFVQGGLRIDGSLNGHPLNALIDCGAAFSTFDFDYVRKVAPGDLYPSNINMEGLDGITGETYVFTPRHLEFGTLAVPSLEMTARQSSTFGKTGFNALLGYDFLASHQAILDLGHDTLWMK